MIYRIMYLNNIFPRVAVLQVTIRVRRAVPALMYALALALIRIPVDSRAHPNNIMRSESSPIFLQFPSNRHKLLHRNLMM